MFQQRKHACVMKGLQHFFWDVVSSVECRVSSVECRVSSVECRGSRLERSTGQVWAQRLTNARSLDLSAPYVVSQNSRWSQS